MEAVITVVLAVPNFVTNRNPKYVYITLYLERHLQVSLMLVTTSKHRSHETRGYILISNVFIKNMC